MRINLLEKNEPVKDVIAFLNSPAKDFYLNKHAFSSTTYSMYIKSLLLAMMNLVENTIKGTFDCDLSLKNVDVTKMAEMFPVGCKMLSTSNGNLSFRSRVLSWLRNINAHAYVSKEDEELFNYKFYELDRLPKFNYNLRNAMSGTITMGGIITLIMLFLRERNIETYCGLSNCISMIASGSTGRCDGKSFVQRISHVNLENPIRKTEGKDINTSIVGEYRNLIKNNKIIIGSPRNPTFHVNFKISDNQIEIKKGSITKVYYKNNYLLSIKEKELFISLSNKFPPFVFVDLLYKMNIFSFDRNIYDKINNDCDKYVKLNYPKYYVDKNIDILLLDETIADQRLVSLTTNTALDYVFLRLEKKIYDNDPELINGLGEDYSKFGKALDSLGISNNKEYIFLRNASLHGYLLGKACIYENTTYVYEFDSVIDTLRELMIFLKNNYSTLYNDIKHDIHNVFIKKMIALKYGRVLEHSLSMIKGKPINVEDSVLNNRYLFVESSMYDFKILNKLFVEDDVQTLINKYIIDGEGYPLYLHNNQVEFDYLKHYLSNKQDEYVITGENNDGLLSTIYLKKK